MAMPSYEEKSQAKTDTDMERIIKNRCSAGWEKLSLVLIMLQNHLFL